MDKMRFATAMVLLGLVMAVVGVALASSIWPYNLILTMPGGLLVGLFAVDAIRGDR